MPPGGDLSPIRVKHAIDPWEQASSHEHVTAHRREQCHGRMSTPNPTKPAALAHHYGNGPHTMATPAAPTIVVVRDAFADASGCGGVIRQLQTASHTVVAPPNPLRSSAFDAAIVACIDAIAGPVVLVGHSHDGAVITAASATLDNVTALVYLAAFGLDKGESCASVQDPFPPSLLASTSHPTSYDAHRAPHGPDLFITKEQFRETFCADVPIDVAEIMFATQRPLSLAALTGKASAVGWKSKPSWYLVSEHDNAIPPDAERFMAERMGATTESISGSHTTFITQPVAVAGFVAEALSAGSKA
jgi:pimeloyl-ACP methyl ester carboxylesterase